MKKIIFFCLVLCSTGLFAQQNNVDKQSERIIQLYKMTPTQATQYKTILKSKSEAMTENGKSIQSDEMKKEALAKIDKKYDEEILAILDEKQTKIFNIQKELAASIKNNKAQNPNLNSVRK